MRYMMMAMLGVLLAACGPGNHPANEHTDNHGHEHDHVHSHAGKSISLGKQPVGKFNVEVWLKDKVQRGGLTVLEVKVEGEAFNPVDLVIELHDPNGEVIDAKPGMHAMAETGRYGLHLNIPEGTARDLTLVLQTGSGPVGKYQIKE